MRDKLLDRIFGASILLSSAFLFAFAFVHSAEAQTWIIGPTTGQHTTVIDPHGNHHIIVDHGVHGGFYRQHPQPGVTQYPNLGDGILQSYRRGVEWGLWRRSLKGK